MDFNYNTLPILSRDIIARQDSNGVLLFQVKTDEMYFVSQAAYQSILLHCNGSQTLREMIEQSPSTTEGKEQDFEQFICELQKRKIIELW